MASTINSTDTGQGGLITTGDSSDELQLQTAETTAVTITSGQQSAFIAGTASAPAVTTTGDLNTGIFFPAGDAVGVATNGAEAARFNSSGNLVFPNGQGIDFSASAGGGATSSLLDDYEQGTWTPALAGSSTPGTFPLTVSSGKYTKIGNMVTLYCAITVGTPSGSPSGNLQITGLPFGCAAGTSANGAAQIGRVGQSTIQSVGFSTRGASNVLYINYIDGSNLAQNIQAGSVATSAIIDFCISYPTT